VGEEKRTNPFLRAGEPAIMAALGQTDPGASFARLRQMKNDFRG
jgi:hydroxyacylglutathione hydrolase